MTLLKALNSQNLSSRYISMLVVSVLAVVAIMMYQHWHQMVVYIVDTQRLIHTLLANHINTIKENRLESGVWLIVLSFAYGVFHAVGPGHGKAVIVTYLGSHKETLGRSVFISMASALLQSFIAVLLVVVIAYFLSLKLSEAHRYGNDITVVSYALVMALGLLIFLTATVRLIRYFVSNSRNNSHSHSHHHHGECGCSHTYTPPKDQSIWKMVLVILSMGLRPCSGALVVLIYAHLVGVFTFGVIATVMMGIGTGLSVSLIGISTLYIRSWFEKRIDTSKDSAGEFPVGQLIRWGGGVFLILFSVSLLNVALAVTQSHPLLN